MARKTRWQSCTLAFKQARKQQSSSRKKTVLARCRPEVEQFEGRIVPSGVPFTPGMDMPIAHDDAIDTDGTNPVVVHVLANDFSLASPLDPSSVALVSSPTHGSVTRNTATGDITYTANMGFAGTDTFKYTVKDNAGDLSNQATVSVVVNRPTANDDFVDTDGTNPVTINVLANDTDPDGNNQIDPTSVAIASNPAHGTVQVNSTTGQITYTAFAGFGSSDSFTYTVKDFPGATSNPGKVTVVVHQPKANDDFIDTDGTNPVVINVLANDTDPDGNNQIDPTSVAIASSPAHGSVQVNPANGQVTYTANADFGGSDSFTYTIKDFPGAVSDPGTVTVVVHRPTANDDFTQATGTTPVAIDVLGNDTDPDGNNQINPASVAIVSGPAHGGVAVDPTTGEVTYTASSGFFGTDTFSYTLKDFPGATSNVGHVTVDVGGAVGVVDDSIDTDAGNPVVIDVLANDSSPSGLDASSVTVASAPSHGTTSVNTTTGAITYTPAQSYAGTDSFTYTVRDGSGITSSPAHVSVVVNRPTANDDFIDTDAGNPVTVDVLANDTDPDGPNKLDPTTVVIVNAPSHGTASVDHATGAITYTSVQGFSGTETIGYTVTDVNGAVSNVATLSVVVNRPTANDDFIDTDAGNAVTIDVLANDTDPDGPGRLDASTVALVSQPSHGVVSINSTTGAITYTPANGYSGTEQFQYTVTDLAGAVSNPAVVTVVVNRPTANDDFTTTLGTAPVAIDVLANDTDPDGPNKLDATTVHIVTGPANGSVVVDPTTGVVTYTANPGFAGGTDSFTYTVTDVANAVSNPARASIVVQYGQISGTLFSDFNADGTLGSNDPGLANQTVYIDANHNGQLDANETSVTTDSGGHYLFTGLGAGAYTVNVDHSSSPNVVSTKPAQASLTATINPSNIEVGGQDFGSVALSSVVPVAVNATVFPSNSHAVNQVYVEGIYDSVLGRAADSAGLKYWMNYLSQPGAARQTMATAIWASPEHRQSEINSYYQTFLGRSADNAGLAFWTQAFAGGAQEGDVVKGIMVSPEFLSSHTANSAFVSALYTEVLGRQGDSVGAAFWQAQLNSGALSRAQVAAAFINGGEAAQLAIDSYYAAFLHRGPDAGASSLLNLAAQGVSLHDLAIAFLASGEYYGDAQAAAQ
jgi:hypothetical protein